MSIFIEFFLLERAICFVNSKRRNSFRGCFLFGCQICTEKQYYPHAFCILAYDIELYMSLLALHELDLI